MTMTTGPVVTVSTRKRSPFVAWSGGGTRYFR
jgi:hypothetical protein